MKNLIILIFFVVISLSCAQGNKIKVYSIDDLDKDTECVGGMIHLKTKLIGSWYLSDRTELECREFSLENYTKMKITAVEGEIL